MPHSLRFVLLLLAVAALLAIGGIIIQDRQGDRENRVVAEQVTRGDSVAGKAAIGRFGCGSCHQIRGVPGALGGVGPSLTGLPQRSELAGHLANTPANMVRWIRDPQGVAPGNGMPDLGVGEQDARDIAAYLYTLKQISPSP
jgi:cytochrome c2